MNPFEFVLTRARRKTVSVRIEGCKVYVCAPRWMSDAAVMAFLESKRGWIERKQSECVCSSVRFARVLAGQTLLDGGTEKPVVFGARHNGEDAERFFFKNVRAVRPYFSAARGDILVEALHLWSLRVGLSPAGVQVRDFKARWGSCDARGLIKLNWRLSMLPVPLRDYVLIHELCHLRELNHSARFWQWVERFCPCYHACRKELKEYSFLTDLYRGDVFPRGED